MPPGHQGACGGLTPGTWMATLRILRKPASILDYAYEDFEVLGYECHPAIKAPVAV